MTSWPASMFTPQRLIRYLGPVSWLSHVLILLALQGSRVNADLSQALCSSDNTGSDSDPTSNQYQSLGACHDTCNGYAYGIVLAENCWCSNTAPSDTVSLTQCNSKCFGYGFEQCGNTDNNLYGYIALGPSPSGTAGSGSGSGSSSSDDSPVSISTTVRPTTLVVDHTQTSVQLVSRTPSIVTLIVSSIPTTSTSTTSTSTASSRSSQVITQPAATSTFTVAGAIVTQTIAPSTTTIASSPLNLTQNRKSIDSSPSGGTIAGAVIGALLGVAVVAALAFFLWRRHRKNKEEEQSNSTLNRNASTLSKSGLLASNRSADPEKDPGSSPSMQQRTSFQHTMDHPIPSSVYVTPPGAGKRRDSKPLVYDQRLNPEAIMQNWEVNGSRASVNTMHDQRDYSRPLKVSNPDIED